LVGVGDLSQVAAQPVASSKPSRLRTNNGWFFMVFLLVEKFSVQHAEQPERSKIRLPAQALRFTMPRGQVKRG
jgi:hypothetical protein